MHGCSRSDVSFEKKYTPYMREGKVFIDGHSIMSYPGNLVIKKKSYYPKHFRSHDTANWEIS